MTSTIPTCYHQVLLDTIDGTFAVSVAGDVELDDHGRIVSPRSVFEENSSIVAVEQESPSSAASAREELLLPVKSKGSRYGVFRVQFNDSKVKLIPNPPPAS